MSFIAAPLRLALRMRQEKKTDSAYIIIDAVRKFLDRLLSRSFFANCLGDSIGDPEKAGSSPLIGTPITVPESTLRQVVTK